MALSKVTGDGRVLAFGWESEPHRDPGAVNGLTVAMLCRRVEPCAQQVLGHGDGHADMTDSSAAAQCGSLRVFALCLFY